MALTLAAIDALHVGKSISREALTSLAADILSRAGVPAESADQVADTLVECQRRGIESHGIAHLGVYIRRIRAGAIAPHAVPRVVHTGTACAVVDGCNALGVLVARAAIDEASRLAQDLGVGACAVRNSNHFGAAGPLVGRAAEQGFIALAFSNAAPTMAPWGGRDAILGTNPIAAAFPREAGQPIIVDLATSAVARARLRQAAQRHETIPGGWALDSDGRPTVDAAAGLAGTIQPFGGVKGYALALTVELLCTALSGGRPGFDVRNPHDLGPEPAGTSHLFIVLDPQHFAGSGVARQRAEALKTHIEAGRAVVGGNPPRLPGARAWSEAARRDRDGIPISPALIAQLRDAVGALGTA